VTVKFPFKIILWYSGCEYKKYEDFRRGKHCGYVGIMSTEDRRALLFGILSLKVSMLGPYSRQKRGKNQID
jgi:hypothetical protein